MMKTEWSERRDSNHGKRFSNVRKFLAFKHLKYVFDGNSPHCRAENSITDVASRCHAGHQDIAKFRLFPSDGNSRPTAINLGAH